MDQDAWIKRYNDVMAPKFNSLHERLSWEMSTVHPDMDNHEVDIKADTKAKALLSPIVENWDLVKRYLLAGNDNCSLPLIAKYAVYAHLDHPSDAIVNDIYAEAVRVAKLSEAKFPHECEVYTPVLDPDTAAHRKSAYALCQIARHPAKDRLEKVVAVETVVSARHTSGPFFEHLCSGNWAAESLVSTVLDIMAGEE